MIFQPKEHYIDYKKNLTFDGNSNQCQHKSFLFEFIYFLQGQFSNRNFLSLFKKLGRLVVLD